MGDRSRLFDSVADGIVRAKRDRGDGTAENDGQWQQQQQQWDVGDDAHSEPMLRVALFTAAACR